MENTFKSKINKIPDDSGGFYTVIESPDIEYVNPIEYYSKTIQQNHFIMVRDFLLAKKPQLPLSMINTIAHNMVEKEWSKLYKEITKTNIPNNFIRLLTAGSKKEQVQLLKGQSFTPNQLFALIIKAWTDFGFSFSQYQRQYYHKGLDKEKLPKVVEVKDDKVKKVGPTSMTDGQLRHAVDHRKVIISKFLDNGGNWHCFFITYKSLRGEEKWKDGQPHYHYISDKFGHDREKVVNNLTSEIYKLGNLPHIDLVGYNLK